MAEEAELAQYPATEMARFLAVAFGCHSTRRFDADRRRKCLTFQS